MPLLNNIVSSIKAGWANLNNDDNLTMLTFSSVISVFLIFFNYELLAKSIFSGQVQLLGSISLQADTLFLLILTISSVASLFIGAYFTKKYNPRLQLFSSVVGLAFGFLLFLPTEGGIGLISYAFIAGFVSTIGIANLLAAFISKTDFSNRGSTSGIFVFIVYVILFIFTILLNEPGQLAIALVTLKIFSIFYSVRIKEFNFDSEQKEHIMTSSRIKLSFLAVWSIFIISNIAASTYLSYLETQPVPFPLSRVELGLITQIIGLFTIFIGGVMMDIYGRKRLMMFSFVYLGVNYALISLSRGYLNWFTALDGIAWGMLTVLFLMILWGDICKPQKRAKWFAVSISISIMSFPGPILGNYILSNFIPGFLDQNTLFPMTSFFLFIAAGLILTLPESLPEKIIQKKELDDYIHMAKKIKAKYKNGKKARKDLT
jgi:hypothetical protein